MQRFIRELRRREVFRTLGFYVGVCWILIEAASIVLPAFEAPDWALRGLITVAIVGFPIVGVLAWVYDVSAKGVTVQADPSDTVVPAFGARRMDFIVIGVLAVALAFSVYLNLTGGPENAIELEPIAVLIADFENDTRDPVFEGLLEQALTFGIEAAPHIAAMDRNLARGLVTEAEPGAEGLSIDAARLVALQQDVGLVLAGSISSNDPGYTLNMLGLDPVTGETSFELSVDAQDRNAVLAAVESLSADVREQLGDPTLREADPVRGAGGLRANSIEAAKAYVDALQIQFEGRHEESIEYYRRATDLDPSLGGAYSGWALAEFNIGRMDEATALWQQALAFMDSMPELRRLIVLGTYYNFVTQSFDEAVETFSEAVEKYPSAASARNNLAVSAFWTLDFPTALEQGREILELFPNSLLYRSNYALFAMYSGDFDTAAAEARILIENTPDYGTGYLPLAIAQLAASDTDAARETYEQMASLATRGAYMRSVAGLGLADVAIYEGRFQDAREILVPDTEHESANGELFAAAARQIALAESYLLSGQETSAIVAANTALELSGQDSTRIAAALVFADAGEIDAAAEIAQELSSQLQAQGRAYGLMLEAVTLRQSGDYVSAIDRLRAAVDLADLWRVRYELGLAYLDAGYFAEAFDELSRCAARRGEATAMYLDDMPTFRYLAELPYWLGRAQEGLGMQTAAAESFEAFLSLRPTGGRFVEDTHARLQ